MDKDEDIQVIGTMSDYLTQKIADEEQGQEFTVEYLKADFLASAANALCSIRRQAGLTQAQVAERLNTKQSAIARLEADFDGAMSLRRYVDFALACGVIPHHITFAPVEAARKFVIEQPGVPFTQENHHAWPKVTFQLAREAAGNTPQATIIVSSSATTLQEVRPRLSIVETQSQTFRLGEEIEATTVSSAQPGQVSTLNQLNNAFQKAA